MNHETAICIQRPQKPLRLVLVFHGVGGTAQSMQGVAQWFAAHEPAAMVISVAAPDASDLGGGWQWFSVRGVTDENRQARVDAAMPAFVACIAHWQTVSGVGPESTELVGFSQGAIMALESSKLALPPAAVVVAIAGRFATLPTQHSPTTVHLLHGDADPVMPVALSRAAQARLSELGTKSRLATMPGLGHEPHGRLLETLA